MMMRRRAPGHLAWVMAVLTGLAIVPVAAQDGPPAAAVGVAAAELADVTPTARFVGRAEAIDRVELRARVTGFLEQRLFEQGDRVTAGDLLLIIEPEPYRARLAQREAELASAEAEVETAQAQLNRGLQLLERDNIPRAEVDERRARLLVAQGREQEARAAIDVAELDLTYTHVTAPINGHIGRYAYSVGAFVGPESGALATIVSRDPIYVSFPVSQSLLTEVRQEAIARGSPLEVVVRAELPTGELYDAAGVVAFADVEVDAGTDTLEIRSTFANPDGLLVPGQFLNVVIERGQPLEALVVPASALLVDQAGTYVLVVGDGDEVEQRRVTLGESEEPTRAVIADGLVAGERVIVEGVQKVRPGEVVTPAPVAELPGA